MNKIYSPEMKPLANQQAVVGYATMFKTYKEALKKKGIEVITEEGDVQLNFMPPLFWDGLVKKFPATKRFVCSMWEADDVKQEWVDIANKHFNALIVPNEYNRSLFVNKGLTIPCIVAGLGINKEYMTYIPRTYTKGDDFYFLHYNAGEVRKGWYILVDAFNEEFKTEPNVKIIFKNSRVHEKTMYKSLSYYPPVNTKAEKHLGSYTIEQMLDLAKKAHCFVFPALGEGYGLTPREMMATGMPTIVSSGSSFDELPDYYIKTDTYLDKGTTSYFPAIKDSLSGRDWVTDNYSEFKLWYVYKDKLRANMRDVYENYNKHLRKAKEGSKKVKTDEDVDLLIQPLIDCLTDLT